jgi:hypothetical protein
MFYNVTLCDYCTFSNNVFVAIILMLTLSLRPGFDPRQRQRGFLPVSGSRPALGPTQPPVQCVPGVVSPGVKRGRGVMLTTNPYLVPRLSMSRSYTSSHPMCPQGMQWDSFAFTYSFFKADYKLLKHLTSL